MTGVLQVTSEGGGGMVSARDFVYVSRKGWEGETFVMGGRSVEYESAPKPSKEPDLNIDNLKGVVVLVVAGECEIHWAAGYRSCVR